MTGVSNNTPDPPHSVPAPCPESTDTGTEIPENTPLFAAATVPSPQAGGSITEICVTGEVERVIYASDDQSYAVLAVRDANKDEWILVGPLIGINEGQDIEAWGRREQHREFGTQIRVTRYRQRLPSTEEGIRRYLASGVIPGLGPKLAERIVDHFGSETMKVLEHFSGRLREIPGFGKGRIESIRQAWKQQDVQRDIFVFLQGLGISAAYCARVYRQFGENAATIVRENPYRLAAEVKGIGFRMADAVATRLGIAKDHPFRLASGVRHVLRELAQQQGHTCCPRSILVEKAGEMLEVDPVAAEQGLDSELAAGNAIADGDGGGKEMIYHRDLYYAERTCAKSLQQVLQGLLASRTPDTLPRTANWNRLNEAQQKAVLTAFLQPVSIITGGPGVGKTTVTREITSIAREVKWRVALAAPTGRAAKRLSESCGIQARTIHRLLKWEPKEGHFTYDRLHPLPCDLLIIDEISMLDIELAASLFQAIRPGTHLVLIGDHDQLPSVGPGCVLHDLIKSNCITTTHLSEVYRQAAGSHIIRNAHLVNRGRMPDLSPAPPRGELRDFYWIEQEDPEKAAEIISRLAAERIPRRFSLQPLRDIQILSPMNRGICGATALNRRLQAVLNPKNGQKWRQLQVGDNAFCEGDRVMQVRNNYDIQVFNGDLGRITRIDTHDKRLTVLFDQGPAEYAFADVAEQLRLAYAITIHKSQGSEFPAVIVPVLTQHYIMLQRNLIYTAMTRAGKLLILVGAAKAMAMAVHNINQSPRYSRLAARLKDNDA